MPGLSIHSERLDTARAAFLDALDAVTPALRGSSPTEGAWSALEIAEHLVRVEVTAWARVGDPLAEGNQLGPPVEERAIQALEAALHDPDTRISVPREQADRIMPAGEWPEAELRERWMDVAERLREAAASCVSEDQGVAVMRHPMAGALSLEQTLRFLTAHLEHHRRQLARTVEMLDEQEG